MNLYIVIAKDVFQLLGIAISEYEILRFVLNVSEKPSLILQIASYFLT